MEVIDMDRQRIDKVCIRRVPKAEHVATTITEPTEDTAAPSAI